MVTIPSSLRTLFSASIEEQDGRYLIEVPSREIAEETLSATETYRVAIIQPPAFTGTAPQETSKGAAAHDSTGNASDGPPVDKGEIRDVTIETVGDQGDGIAKVKLGYVVIVPGAQPGDEPTVEIEEVRANVAFASVVEPDSRTL